MSGGTSSAGVRELGTLGLWASHRPMLLLTAGPTGGFLSLHPDTKPPTQGTLGGLWPMEGHHFAEIEMEASYAYSSCLVFFCLFVFYRCWLNG